MATVISGGFDSTCTLDPLVTSIISGLPLFSWSRDVLLSSGHSIVAFCLGVGSKGWGFTIISFIIISIVSSIWLILGPYMEIEGLLLAFSILKGSLIRYWSLGLSLLICGKLGGGIVIIVCSMSQHSCQVYQEEDREGGGVGSGCKGDGISSAVNTAIGGMLVLGKGSNREQWSECSMAASVSLFDVGLYGGMYHGGSLDGSSVSGEDRLLVILVDI